MQMIKLAEPEKKLLGYAVGFMMFSSAVSLSVPYGMGRIIDTVLDPSGEVPLDERSMNMVCCVFISRLASISVVLAGIFVLGAGANFGRVWSDRHASLH